VESFTSYSISTWAAKTTYASNQYVTNGGNIYYPSAGSISYTSGNSGGPTGTGTNIADGGMLWDYVEPVGDRDFSAGFYYILSGTTYLSAVYHDELDGYGGDFIAPAANTTPHFVITAALKTAPLSFAGILGFQRLYRIQLVHTGSPYFVTYPEQVDFLVESNTGELSIQDNGSWTNPPAIVEHLCTVQKCTSIQLTVTITTFRRQQITALNLLVGVKSDYARLPSGQRG
jgi:hypothetical protein